jgi:hypothetical protein
VQQGANAKPPTTDNAAAAVSVHDREQDICVELSTLEDLPQRHHHFGQVESWSSVDDGRPAENFQRPQR